VMRLIEAAVGLVAAFIGGFLLVIGLLVALISGLALGLAERIAALGAKLIFQEHGNSKPAEESAA